MRARYAGPCNRCGVTIEKGEDCEYFPEKKTIGHWNCPETVAHSESPEQLAERLGFIRFDPGMDSDGLLQMMQQRRTA